jgi:putative heme-binding domain-containing protein
MSSFSTASIYFFRSAVRKARLGANGGYYFHMHRMFFAVCLVAVLVVVEAAEFVGAPEPAASPASPVSGLEQKGRFSLPPGFEIELVASEEQGVGKPITVAWDDSARLWTMTALEYPLDANEQPEAARALYAKGGKDRVLVFDEPYIHVPQAPRVFAEGLAMPMGILPYKDGAIVGHGPDVLFLRDRNGDGKADAREVLLTGFGIQDSHLMPHQFTRAPGGWFYLAQGAFNYSRVRTRGGREIKFDQTRLARFTPDGMQFEDITSGPCNIWGLVIGREGETFIQEANDYGYPVMALQAMASYPGCSGAFRPYAPYFPSEVEFRMGGTGLSGLAQSDPVNNSGGFPGAYADVMYVANPITRKVQALKIHRDGGWYRYEKLPDFVLCADEWFRPVAIHFGPDGCLYVVDWYNKIISHNEVPRAHPERDKTRGRIWRVRHKDQPRVRPANVAAADEKNLVAHLEADSTWEMRAAWHQIVDRNVRSAAPELKRIVENSALPPERRIHALWALEDLRELSTQTILKLSAEPNRNIRREAIRALATIKGSGLETMAILADHVRDGDPQVRAEVIQVARSFLNYAPMLQVLARMVQPSLAAPAGKSPHSGQPMKLREAYDRDFERYLIRFTLEQNPEVAKKFLDSTPGKAMSVEAQLLFALALPAEESRSRITSLLGKIDRIPNEEELLRLSENLNDPDSLDTLRSLLAKADARPIVLESLLKVRNRLDAAKLGPVLQPGLKALWEEGNRDLAARVAGGFKVQALAPEMDRALAESPAPLQSTLLRALREMDAASVATLAGLARTSTNRAIKDEALNSLVASKQEVSQPIVEFWPELNALQRRSALRALSGTPASAKVLRAAVSDLKIHPRDLDAETMEKLASYFPTDADIKKMTENLLPQFQPVLRLDGKNESYVDSTINLEGPFTVETWVRLEAGISNADGILGYPGGPDFNFANGVFRVYCGPDFGDRAIARKPMVGNLWTHIGVTRDAQGVFRLYLNGELDSTDERKVTAPLTGLDIGRTSPSNGTMGDLTEFRVWNRARSAEEVRADFDRTFAGEPLPSGLTHFFTGAGPWGALKGGARVEKVFDAPALLTAAQAREQEGRFAHFRRLAEKGGNLEKGKAVFATACSVCHSVGGQGGQIGPVLNGAAASGIETLLRATLTPNAAMEAGYRNYRIELTNDEIIDGFLVSQDDSSVLVRQVNKDDQRIPKNKIRRAEYTRQSIMPEGLLDGMHPEDVRDLFAYLRTLK